MNKGQKQSKNATMKGTNITGTFLLLSSLFVTLLITANITAVKIIDVAGTILPAAIIIFPGTYILGDIFAEVYGLRLARRVIFIGFVCNAVAVAVFWIGGVLPAAEFWDGQSAYESKLGYKTRLLIASITAYLVGELLNASILAKVKIITQGRWLWIRTISSTIVGQGVDSTIFITLAFVGTLGGGQLIEMVITQWLVKVAYEAAATPLTYVVVGYLKNREGRDTYG